MTAQRIAAPTRRRFWSKVDRSGTCWEWTAHGHPKGYGHFNFRGRKWRAHRFSWLLHTGEDPGEKLVLHRCDNPPCVRPDHLELGTRLDNARHARERGQVAKGVRHGNSRLDPRKVREIREMAGGHTYREIAEVYGIARSTVSQIVNRDRWAHIS